MKLLTLNTWFDQYELEERWDAITQAIIKNEIDFILFQEITNESLYIINNSELGKHYHMNDHSYEAVRPYGQLTLSKYFITSTHLEELPTSMHRKALVTDIDVNGKEIKICNVHLESMKGYEQFRIDQLTHLFNLPNRSTIIAGDFNFHDKWEEQNHVISEYEDVWAELKKGHDGFTVDTNINLMKKRFSRKDKMVRFDRIIYEREAGLKFNKIRLFGTREIEVGLPGTFMSDHFGLLAEFEV